MTWRGASLCWNSALSIIVRASWQVSVAPAGVPQSRMCAVNITPSTPYFTISLINSSPNNRWPTFLLSSWISWWQVYINHNLDNYRRSARISNSPTPPPSSLWPGALRCWSTTTTLTKRNSVTESHKLSPWTLVNISFFRNIYIFILEHKRF